MAAAKLSDVVADDFNVLEAKFRSVWNGDRMEKLVAKRRTLSKKTITAIRGYL